MKKLTAILLSALLVLSLAACGNNNQNAAEDTPAETVAPTTEPDESSITQRNPQMMKQKIPKLWIQRKPETEIFWLHISPLWKQTEWIP